MAFGFSREFQRMVAIYFLSSFLFGFIPGFYLPLILMLKMKKLEILLPYSVGIAFISGLIIGYYSNVIFFWMDVSSIHNNLFTFLNYNIPYFVVLEIVIVIFHFFFVFKRKKKSDEKNN